MKNELKTIIRSLVLEAMRELAPGQKPKMIFLAGGAGSGKSTILRALDVRARGFQVIDPDEAYEEGLRQSKLGLDVGKAEQEYMDIKAEYEAAQEAGKIPAKLEKKYQLLRGQASQRGSLFAGALKGAKEKAAGLAKEQHDFIVDGTGGDIRAITKLNDEYKQLGYDTAMIFVHVELETSLKRNRERGQRGGRTLRDEVIERSWQNVHKNEEAYKAMFGKNFFYVDGENLEASLGSVAPKIIRFLATSVGKKKP